MRKDSRSAEGGFLLARTFNVCQGVLHRQLTNQHAVDDESEHRNDLSRRLDKILSKKRVPGAPDWGAPPKLLEAARGPIKELVRETIHQLDNLPEEAKVDHQDDIEDLRLAWMGLHNLGRGRRPSRDELNACSAMAQDVLESMSNLFSYLGDFKTENLRPGMAPRLLELSDRLADAGEWLGEDHTVILSWVNQMINNHYLLPGEDQDL